MILLKTEKMMVWKRMTQKLRTKRTNLRKKLRAMTSLKNLKKSLKKAILLNLRTILKVKILLNLKKLFRMRSLLNLKVILILELSQKIMPILSRLKMAAIIFKLAVLKKVMKLRYS